MSQENVEIVRSGLEAAARNDWNAAMASVDPNVEWVEMPSLGPDASSYTGVEELRKAINSWIGMWSEYDVEVVRYADADDDVVVLFRERGHGGVSGAAVERELGEVFTLRDGKVVRVRLYGSWREALEAAGLRE
jgi:ketosteroid isomerase-like protein